MKHIKSFILTSTALCSLAISVAQADEYALDDDNIEALYFDFVYEPKVVKKPSRTNFIKDEVVLLYSTEDISKVKKITQKYNLKPASSTVLA